MLLERELTVAGFQNLLELSSLLAKNRFPASRLQISSVRIGNLVYEEDTKDPQKLSSIEELSERLRPISEIAAFEFSFWLDLNVSSYFDSVQISTASVLRTLLKHFSCASIRLHGSYLY